MLSDEAGEGLGSEVRELGDGLLRLGQPFFELGVLRFEAGDLRFAGVGDLTGLLENLEAALEFCSEVGIGAGAVEGGAVDSRLAGKGLDVAFAALWDLAAQEPVRDGPNVVLVLGALGCSDSHEVSWSGAAAAVSMFAMTRIARSWSAWRRARSVLRGRPSCPRKVLVRSAWSAQTGR
ncbi:hypothetical protein AB0L13_43470 [Saccharopolyspora shandongensis]|uniref:hypothetical protein n=1 Tax=Saccharopolyspora shandongensis TaxID=418495 RepID=UPI0034283D9C